MGRTHHHTKTDVPVPIIRIVPVAIRTAGVPVIVVERAATRNTGDVFRPAPPALLTDELYPALLLMPAAEQFPNFGHHFGDMFVLRHAQELHAMA